MSYFLTKRLLLTLFLPFLFLNSFSTVSGMEEVKDPEASRYAPKNTNISKTQEEINAIVASTAQEIYNKINANWHYVAPGSELSTELSTASRFWEAKLVKGRTTIEGKEQELLVPSLVLKDSSDNIIEALEDLINKPALVECTIALTTVKIFCLKKILGDEYFTRYARVLYGLFEDEFFHELPMQFIKQVEGSPIPGSIGYLPNVPLYAQLFPNGNDRGINVVCSHEDQYIGFGEAYQNGSRSTVNIALDHLESFCKGEELEHKKEELREMHGQLCSLYKKKPKSFVKECRETQEEYYNFYWIFDAEEINEYFETFSIKI